MQAIHSDYGFASGHVDREIAFKNDVISLDIPIEGLMTNEGWKIRPMSPLSVRKYVTFEVLRLETPVTPQCFMWVEIASLTGSTH